MPATLSCTISKIITIPNEVNADIVSNYQEYMRDNGASERHENNALKAVIAYAKFLGENITFYDVSANEQITAYLDTKIKTQSKILTRNGLQRGITICTESNIYFAGFTTKGVSTKRYQCQNG